MTAVSTFSWPPVEAVTFDATGTLFHAPRLGAIYAEVFARHGLATDAETLEGLIHTVWQELSCVTDGSRDRFGTHPDGARGWWRRFVERVAEHLSVRLAERPEPADSPWLDGSEKLPERIRFAAAELYERFAHAESYELYPDALSTLGALRQAGLALAVVSNWDARLEGVLAGLGIAPLIDATVYSSAVGYEKPDRRIFEAALGRIGVSARASVHVGDRARDDVEGAAALGMRTILLDRRGRHGACEADRTVRSLDEIPRLVLAGEPA